MRKKLLSLSLLFICATPFFTVNQLGASEKVYTFRSRENTQLRLENYLGNISISGWNQDRIKVKAILKDASGAEVDWPEGFSLEEESFDGGLRIRPVKGKNSTIQERLKFDKKFSFKLDLFIDAPAHRPLDVRLAEGRLEIENWREDVSVSSQGGLVVLKKINSSKSLEVISPQGGITGDKLSTKHLRFTSASGKVVLNNVIADRAYIETQSGGLELNDVKFLDSDLISSQGEIHVDKFDGSLRFVSDSGNILLDKFSGSASGVTGSGEISLQSDHWRQEDLSFFESKTGNIFLNFPNDFRAQVDIETGSFNVAVQFPSTILSVPLLYGPPAPGRWIGVIREQSQLVRVRSISGDIKIF